MKKGILLLIICLLYQVSFPQENIDTMLMKSKWGKEKAWEYMNNVGVVKGCNYVPSYSNYFWFDFREEIINEELGWANNIGLNSIRVFIPCTAYQEDKNVFFENVDKLLNICQENNLTVMVVLDSHSIKDPAYKEKLKAPKIDIQPGVHGSSAPIEGLIPRQDPQHFTIIKQFSQEFIKKYAHDKRIIAWDLYNEAWKKDTLLLKDLFIWAREINPSQPLTACWYAHKYSDIISFHTYQKPGDKKGQKTLPNFPLFEEEVAFALSFDRPTLCTEWLARPFGNTFESVLPTFAANNIGWYNWGLVAGTQQYRFPWQWPQGSPEPYVWFHDLLYPDGHPYRYEEIEAIKYFTFCKPNIMEKFNDEKGYWSVYP